MLLVPVRALGRGVGSGVVLVPIAGRFKEFGSTILQHWDIIRRMVDTQSLCLWRIL